MENYIYIKSTMPLFNVGNEMYVQFKGEVKIEEDNPLFEKKYSPKELKKYKNIAKSWLDGKYASCGSDIAYWNLAACYDLGIGTEANRKKASDYYKLSMFQKIGLDELKIPDVTYCSLQISDSMLVFTFPDVIQAYTEAENLEYPTATFLVGLAYLSGIGTREDNYFANSYFEKAIQRGCPEAYSALANSYYRGYGVPRDFEKAVSLWKKGYTCGDLESGFILAQLYIQTGIPEGYTIMYNLAHQKKYQRAIDFLNSYTR